jgi:hypothetical protein
MLRASLSKPLQEALKRDDEAQTAVATSAQTSPNPQFCADDRANAAAGLAPRERRRAPRRQRLRNGLISDGAGLLVSCTIVDISDVGAKVAFDGSISLPAQFYLIDIRDRVAFEARLARSAAPEHGLILTRRLELRDLAKPPAEAAIAGESGGPSSVR